MEFAYFRDRHIGFRSADPPIRSSGAPSRLAPRAVRTATPRAGSSLSNGERTMPEQKTIERARRDKRQAGAQHASGRIRARGDRARSRSKHGRVHETGDRDWAVKARRAGVKLPPPPQRQSNHETSARSASRAAGRTRKPSRRDRAPSPRVEAGGAERATRKALSRQATGARSGARRRTERLGPARRPTKGRVKAGLSPACSQAVPTSAQ